MSSGCYGSLTRFQVVKVHKQNVYEQITPSVSTVMIHCIVSRSVGPVYTLLGVH